MDTTKEATSWLSAYIYYSEPWKHLLQDALYAFMDTGIKTGLVKQYYFERYWERGPHLRLHIQGDHTALERVLRPHLVEHFMQYMEHYPSARIDPNYPSHFPDHYKWHPNNSILFFPYQPSVEQFGNEAVLALCEKHFFHTSHTVLSILKEHTHYWNYDDAMSNALQLHLIFAYAMGLSQRETVAFFMFYFKNWIDHSPPFKQIKFQQRSSQEIQDTERTYERAFEFQKNILGKLLRQIWNKLEEDPALLPPIFAIWYKQSKAIHTQLEQLLQTQKVPARTAEYRYPYPGDCPEQQQSWALYADMIAKTNNQLGIVHRDESFIAYLIAQSLKNNTTPPTQVSTRPVAVPATSQQPSSKKQH